MKDNEREGQREKEREKIGGERGEKAYKKEKNEEERDQGSERENMENVKIDRLEKDSFFAVLIFMSTVYSTNYTGQSVNVTFNTFCKKKYEE
jgi:hypothetical protein